MVCWADVAWVEVPEEVDSSLDLCQGAASRACCPVLRFVVLFGQSHGQTYYQGKQDRESDA